MSAFIVGKTHIDYLVQAMLSYNRRGGPDWFDYYYAPNRERREVTVANADEIGSLLWTENHKSIVHRYPGCANDDSNMPGPIGISTIDFVAYTYTPARHLLTHADIAQVLKAIHCYEYQSCEHDEWDASEARAICRALESHLVRKWPGYADADWEICSED